MTRKLLTLALLLPVAVLCSCERLRGRPGDIVYIPNGYKGTVEITYGVAGAKPLTLESGKRVFIIPGNGRFMASSPFMPGVARGEFYYLDDHRLTKLQIGDFTTHTGEVWGGGIVDEVIGGRRLPTRQVFFIGSEAEFRKHSSHRR